MPPDPRETTLLPRAVAGDRAALAQLLLLHHDAVRRHIDRRLADASLTVVQGDDILQQTFVRAAQGIKRFEVRSGGGFRSWLKTVTRNTWLNLQKQPDWICCW